MSKRWNREQTDALIVLWNAGMPARDIADSFQRRHWDITRDAVLGQIKRLRDSGVDVKRIGEAERQRRWKDACYPNHASASGRNLGVGAE